MAVQVTGVGGAGVSIQKVDQHPTGSTIFVQDGHLHVATGWSMKPHQTLAVYAPGEWRSAEVVEARQRGSRAPGADASLVELNAGEERPMLHEAGQSVSR